MVTKKIAAEIKKTLDGFDERKMYVQMQRHYKLLHLMDEAGKWVTPELAKISHELLPGDMTEKKTKAFVDKIAQIAEQNPYLVKFLEEIKDKKFGHLFMKVKAEGGQIFSDVVAYAIVLERLTKAMHDDFKILKVCVEVFENARKKLGLSKLISLKHKIKILSIETPIKKIFLKSHESGVVPKSTPRLVLPINILEAAFFDYFSGYRENACVGWMLAVHRPGSRKYDLRTGAGPSVWSEDKKAIACAPPLPKEWADLYQVWNMAFTSQFSDCPYMMTKLMIPQVAKYQDKPENYLYNRVLALYVYLNYTAILSIKNVKTSELKLQWSDSKLTSLWGKSNIESAREYESKLATRKMRKNNELIFKQPSPNP